MYSTRSLWQRVVLPKLVCLLAVFLLALTSAAGAQTSLRLDADKDKPQPRNWRLMTDAWLRSRLSMDLVTYKIRCSRCDKCLHCGFEARIPRVCQRRSRKPGRGG